MTRPQMKRQCLHLGCFREPRMGYAHCDQHTRALTAYAFGPTRQMNKVERIFIEPRETP